MGNSISRDTAPNLTFTRDVTKVGSTCLPETLGSDHDIIQLENKYDQRPTKTGTARLTDWNAFRNELDGDNAIADIDAWLTKILDTAKRCTKVMQLNEDNPAVDSHLLHLWEARRVLLMRWKRQKSNKKLRKRISLLKEEAQQYAEHLARHSWRDVCDKLQGTLSTKKTWRLLRTLLGDRHTKTQQRQRVRQLTQNYDGSEEDLLHKLCNKLRDPVQSVAMPPPHKEYEGMPNSNLDRPFTLAELQAALSKLTRNTSPGKDRIVNSTSDSYPIRL